jgi:transcriptional regulator with XRE-family HTH domain
MSYKTQEIVKTLKAARESKGLSQRALAEKAGVLQTQISKIENGVTDFRLSTLVALARALGLEFILVPRKAVSAVQSVVRASEPTAVLGHKWTDLRKEHDRLRKTLANLSDTTKLTIEYAQLQRQIRDLQNFQLNKPQLETLRKTVKSLQAFRDPDAELHALRHATSKIQSMRNALAHGSANVPQIDTVKPAYTLDEEDSDG